MTVDEFFNGQMQPKSLFPANRWANVISTYSLEG
jgi:hypothetical protein